MLDKRIVILIAFIFINSLLLYPAILSYADITGNPADNEYDIGPGDTIEVSVWNHPELTKQVKVRPDGNISFPLVGNVPAKGLTPSELEDNVTKSLLKYLKDPQVSVIVMDYKSKNVLVIGAVGKPGLYQFEGDMTVFSVIGLAGGYTKFAELRSILVVRNAYSGDMQYSFANLYNVMKYGDISGDIKLQPKDIVYVPTSYIGNVKDFFDFFTSTVQPVASSYYLYEGVGD